MVKVNDIVKSLDFNGIDNCYMVGKVVGVQEREGTFRAKFIKQVWEGKEDKKNITDYFTAPLQGQLMGDNDRMPRITVIA